MKLLIIRQQHLHVCLQQEADLLLSSPLALSLFLLLLFLFAEDGVQVFRYWKTHHEVWGDQRYSTYEAPGWTISIVYLTWRIHYADQ